MLCNGIISHLHFEQIKIPWICWLWYMTPVESPVCLCRLRSELVSPVKSQDWVLTCMVCSGIGLRRSDVMWVWGWVDIAGVDGRQAPTGVRSSWTDDEGNFTAGGQRETAGRPWDNPSGECVTGIRSLLPGTRTYWHADKAGDDGIGLEHEAWTDDEPCSRSNCWTWCKGLSS